jgi:hypothetical protein
MRILAFVKTLLRQAKKGKIETGKIKYNCNGGIIDGCIWVDGSMCG